MWSSFIRVRAYECDSLGHVNNTVYMQYILEATIELLAIRDPVGTPLQPQSVAIEYQVAARYGNLIEIESGIRSVSATDFDCTYRLCRATDQTLLVAAHITWQLPPPLATRLQQLPTEDSSVVKPFNPPAITDVYAYRLRQQVRHVECDLSGNAALASYFVWIETAFFRALEVADWSLNRLRAADFISIQARHDATFFGTVSEGDTIEVVSRLISVRKVRGTWVHDIFNATTGAHVMREYSTGAFITWSGQLRTPPEGMVEALRQGSSLATFSGS